MTSRMEPNRFSYSSLSCYSSCPRKFWFTYEQGIRRKDSDRAMLFGQAIGLACDEFFAKAPIEEAISAFDSLIMCDVEGDDKRTIKTGHAIIEGYYRTWEADEFEEVISTEEKLELPLGELTFVAKIDKMVRHYSGLCPLDHKTTSMELSKFAKTVELNHQFTGYVWAAQQKYGSVVGLIVDAIHVPKPHKDGSLMKKDGTSLLSYRREITGRNEQAIQDWKDWVFELAEQIEIDRIHAVWIKKTERCGDWNRVCEFFDLCRLNLPLTETLYQMEGELNYEKVSSN